jgi:hypothetical protein
VLVVVGLWEVHQRKQRVGQYEVVVVLPNNLQMTKRGSQRCPYLVQAFGGGQFGEGWHRGYRSILLRLERIWVAGFID